MSTNPMQTMTRAIRVADMLWRFDKGQRMTAREICERYGVSRRTLQRDLADIEQFIMPIDRETSFASKERGEPRYGIWRFKE